MDNYISEALHFVVIGNAVGIQIIWQIKWHQGTNAPMAYLSISLKILSMALLSKDVGKKFEKIK